MEIDAIIVAMPLLLAWLGSVEWRLRGMRSDAEAFIDLKQESLLVIQEELRKDISRLEKQIDELTTALWTLAKK